MSIQYTCNKHKQFEIFWYNIDSLGPNPLRHRAEVHAASAPGGVLSVRLSDNIPLHLIEPFGGSGPSDGVDRPDPPSENSTDVYVDSLPAFPQRIHVNDLQT